MSELDFSLIDLATAGVIEKITEHGNQRYWGMYTSISEVLRVLETITQDIPDIIGFSSWPSCANQNTFPFKITSANIVQKGGMIHTVSYAHYEPAKEIFIPAINTFCAEKQFAIYDISA